MNVVLFYFLFAAILFYVNNFFPADTSIGCVMRCNLRALQNEDFKTVGQMLATIIIQGGEHPRIFSPAICCYIEKGLDFCQPGIDEVPDPIVRESLQTVVGY